jgi:hypothetical protein
MNKMSIARATGMMTLCAMVTGCATQMTRPASAPVASTVRLGTFKAVELETATIAPAFAEAGPNKKAAKKINEHLIKNLSMVFPGLKTVDKSTASAGSKTLVIRPVIKEIKFIGGAARFWIGAMAGSSAVLMEVDFIDMSSGTSVAKPEFFQSASAMSGGWGKADNMMLKYIADDVSNYSSNNR